LLFSRSEAHTRSRNTGVAACGSFCSLNVKLSTNQPWENLCFQTRSSTRFSIKSSRFSITGSRFSMKGSRFSILDSRRNRESRLATECQFTFERYCYFFSFICLHHGQRQGAAVLKSGYKVSIIPAHILFSAQNLNELIYNVKCEFKQKICQSQIFTQQPQQETQCRV